MVVDQIDLPLFKIAFPENTTADLILWIEPMKAACHEYGIDTVREVASFLANIAVESRGMTQLTESLNYSVKGLLEKFGRHRISVAQCQEYGRTPDRKANQEAIANILYGGEWGKKNLGNILPGDGWKFRGYGLKQTTGRANQQAFATAVSKRIDDIPAYLRTREGACRSAGFFWKSHGLDVKAATPGVKDDRIAINGGTNGLDVVEPRFNAILKALLNRGC